MEWFAVRCIFRFSDDGPEHIYEERVTLWRATTSESAIQMAMDEAEQYADNLDDEDGSAERLGLAQAYRLPDMPGHGAEVFSLMRDSSLEPDDYLAWFFDTGSERNAVSEGDD